MRIKYLLLLICILSTTSCATVEKSILTGAAAGVATNHMIGHQHGPKTSRSHEIKSFLFSSALGSLIGWSIFNITNKKKDKDNEEGLQAPKAIQKKSNKDPFLTKPKVKKMWVEDQIKGNRFIVNSDWMERES